MRFTHKIIFAFYLFIVFGALFSFIKAEETQAATVYLTPASGSTQVGSNLVVNVRMNTEGKYVSAVSLKFTFDTSKVDESQSSYTASGSTFESTLFMSLANGVFSVQQFVRADVDPSGNGIPTAPVSGDVFLGKLTILTTGTTGDFNINIPTGEGQTVVYDHNALPDVDPSLATIGTGGRYTLTAVPQSTTTTSSGGTTTTTSKSGTGKTSTTTNDQGTQSVDVPNTAGDTTDPAISAVEFSDLADTSVTITWTTDEQSTSYVDYGETTDYGFGGGDADYTTDHRVYLKGLKANTNYNFRVISSDRAGNTVYSKNQTFTTKPPVSVQRTYRFIGLAMIVGGIAALAIIAFYYFRKKGPHPDNLPPDSFTSPSGPKVNLNPPI